MDVFPGFLENAELPPLFVMEADTGGLTAFQLVFLPTTRSPELNLIEVIWLYWMQLQAAINNPTFLNEQDIGKAVSDWTYDYNKKSAGRTSSISLQEVSCVYITVNLTFFFNYKPAIKMYKEKGFRLFHSIEGYRVIIPKRVREKLSV